MNQRLVGRLARTALAAAGAMIVGCSTDVPGDDPQGSPGTSAMSNAPPLHETSSAGPLVLDWDEDATAQLIARRDAFAAHVTNTRDAAVDVDLLVTARVRGRTTEHYLRHVHLPAGGTEALRIPTSALPVQSTTPSDVQLVALLTEQGLAKAVHSTGLQVAFSADGSIAYASARDSYGPMQAARGAAPVSRFSGPDAPAATDDIAVGDPVLLPPEAAEALEGSSPLEQAAIPIAPAEATSVVLCTKWSGSFSDTHLGEDYVDEGHIEHLQTGAGTLDHWVRDPHPARFASATVTGAAGTVWKGTLDVQGCTPAISMAAGSFSFTVTTKLVSGTSTYDIYKVFEQTPGTSCTPTRISNPPKKWCESNDSVMTRFTVPSGTTGTRKVDIPAGPETPSSRVASVAGQILATTDRGLHSNDTYTIYSNSGCPYYKDPSTGVVWYNWDEACGGSTAYFGLSQAADHHDMTTVKYVIAHELGHQLQTHQGSWMLSGGGDYPPAASAPVSCKCDFVEAANKLHCLQSRHAWWTAEIEGWAHFIAQRTFNSRLRDDPVFAYYKEVRTDDGVTHHPPFVLDALSPVKWTANHCPLVNKSSEWDLLTFLTTLNGGSAPNALSMSEIFGVYEKLRSTSAPRTWAGMDGAALAYFGNDANNAKYKRFHAAGVSSGVGFAE